MQIEKQAQDVALTKPQKRLYFTLLYLYSGVEQSGSSRGS
jgi:hypothetical protein